MSTSFNLTHTQLERLAQWFDTTNAPSGAFNYHSYIRELLQHMLHESNFVFSVTLRYPTATIDRDIISWIIEYIPPMDMEQFHKTLGY